MAEIAAGINALAMTGNPIYARPVIARRAKPDEAIPHMRKVKEIKNHD